MISWTRVEQLREEMGGDGFDELVVLFLEEADKVTESLRQDTESMALMDQLHFLKGCAANIGFEQVQELCTRAEIAAKEGNFAAIDLSEILDVYTASRAGFLKNLDVVNS